MKRIKTAIAMILAMVLCFSAACPVMGAETADEAAAKEEAVSQEMEKDPDGSVDGRIDGSTNEDTVEGEIVASEMSALIEEAQSEKSSESNVAAQSNENGDSKITWTKNTMPKCVDITSNDTIKRAFLEKVQDGYMRVVYDGKKIVVEYFDGKFNMTKQAHIPMELTRWGGFYKGKDAYYIAEAQNNANDINGTEVIRIIKYDLDWNRIGAGHVLAANKMDCDIRYPFYLSSVNMSEVNGKLYLITGTMNYGGHQSSILVRMDEKTYDAEIINGSVYHSFAQFIGTKDADLFICELAESARCTLLSRLDTSRPIIDPASPFSQICPTFEYGGDVTSEWEVPYYASVNDMALSSKNVYCLGTSIDQSQYDNVTSDMAFNVYLTVTPMSDLDPEHTSVKWLTAYTGGEKRFYGTNITKVNDDRFLVTWEEYTEEYDKLQLADLGDTLSSGTLHYVFVDGSGKKISKEFTAPAMFSECHPIINGSKVVYFASNQNCLDFYTIDAKSGKFSKSVKRIAGDNTT